MAEELLNREEAIELLNQNWAARGAAGLQPDRGGGQRPPNNNPQEDRQPNEGDNAQREQQHQPAEPTSAKLQSIYVCLTRSAPDGQTRQTA